MAGQHIVPAEAGSAAARKSPARPGPSEVRNAGAHCKASRRSPAENTGETSTGENRNPPAAGRLSLRRRERLLPGMRIGLLGGSFNPPHEGHRHISLVARRRLDLNAVWWLVSPQNPLKPPDNTADLQRRLAAAEALARHPRIVVSDIEARLGTRYTADTLRALKARFPGVHFVWLMGADNLVQLPHWKHWQDIMSLVPVAVIDRPGYALKAQLGKAAERFRQARVPEMRARNFASADPPAWIYLHARLNPSSATEIRRRGGWP